MEKTKVETIHQDGQYKEWKTGERGYIDGYCRAADNRPYACVVFADRIVQIPLTALKPITPTP